MIDNLTTDELIAAGVIAQFDPETGEFLGYTKTEDAPDEFFQSDEDTALMAETIH